MSKRYPGGIIRKTPQTPSQTSAQGVWDMTSVTQAVKENTWPIAGVPDPVSKSLRFRSSASAYLNRTPASAGSTTTWTWSGWVKRGALGAYTAPLFAYINAGATTQHYVVIDSDVLKFVQYASSTLQAQINSTAVLRDPSAWYHIVAVWNTTSATSTLTGSSTDRMRIYINGVQVSSFSASVVPTQNLAGYLNTTVNHGIGTYGTYLSSYFDGYLAEVNFIDGQALTPSSFGSTNDQTGVWQPIAYTGTYGTNGFYLPFSNTASTTTLGYDFSGNSNNWTPNNISLTSGSTYDSMVDVPTQWIPYNTAGDTGALYRGNYCVMNPLTSGTQTTLTGANLNLSQPSGSVAGNSRSTFAMITGKWYMEVTLTANSSSTYPQIGIMTSRDGNRPNNDNPQAGFSTSMLDPTLSVIYMADGQKQTNGSSSSYGSSFTNGDVIGVAIDSDNGAIYFGKQSGGTGSIVWQNSGDPTSGSSKTGAALTWTGGTVDHVLSIAGYNGTAESVNFGQRPFSANPPSGFKTLCTTNLPTPTIGTTSTTQANDYFNAVLYTGNGSVGRAVTGVGFKPDFTWIKSRSDADYNYLVDIIRTYPNRLFSNLTDAASTESNTVTSSDSDGFTVGSDAGVNGNTATYVAWNWKANGSGSTNTAGTITSTVSANTSAGFSIVTYTGTGANATVGHGLGVAPSMIIVKNRTDSNTWWLVYHQNLTSAAYYLALQRTDAQASSATIWNNTAPTSSVFTVGTSNDVNGSTKNLVAYCFAPVAGYSAFGSYTGNGSADGPFVFTGFRPRFVLVKRTDSTSSWGLIDTARDTYNVTTKLLFPNASDAENTSYTPEDILSNGFKLRDTTYNISSGTYIYMAFAESPFKYALAR